MNQPNAQQSQFTLKALLVGLVGCVFIASSSVYVALRLSSLPWVILFAVIVSYSLLIRNKKGNLSSVNVAHTVMTSGSMTAAAVAFIIPAWWRLYPDQPLSPYLMIAVMFVAIIIALSYTYLLRPYLLSRKNLPFPIGQVAYDTLIACHQKGSKSRYLFISTAVTAVFTFLRDRLQVIPALLVNNHYGMIPASPMALAMGYILGPSFALTWGISSLLTVFAVLPLFVHFNLASTWDTAKTLQSTLGLGFLIGGSLGLLTKLLLKPLLTLKLGFASSSALKTPLKLKRKAIIVLLALLIVTFIGLLYLPLPVSTSLFIFPVTLIATLIIALLVGQGGISPLEVIGAMAFLALSVSAILTPLQALVVILLCTTVCALTGDMLNDFKAGQLLNTSPKALLISDALGAVVGTVVSITTLYTLKNGYDLFAPNSLFTMAQSSAIATILSGQSFTPVTFIALGLGFILAFSPLQIIAVALGFYLAGFGLGSLIGLGGLLALLTNRFKKQEMGTLIGAGMLAGEGLMGCVLAFVLMLSPS